MRKINKRLSFAQATGTLPHTSHAAATNGEADPPTTARRSRMTHIAKFARARCDGGLYSLAARNLLAARPRAPADVIVTP